MCYLERLKQLDSQGSATQVHYQTVGEDAARRLTAHWLGDGSSSLHSYLAGSDKLNSRSSGNHNQDIQDLSYSYDTIGNLSSRSDNLNRLISAQVQGQSAITNSYDLLGNLMQKSDQGTLNYGRSCGSTPHDVCELKDSQGIVLSSYQYYTNGNLSQDNTRGISWTSFNKPGQIT